MLTATVPIFFFFSSLDNCSVWKLLLVSFTFHVRKGSDTKRYRQNRRWHSGDFTLILFENICN